MTELAELHCEECKELFFPGRVTQRFCSKLCKQRWSSRDWRAKNPEAAKAHDRKNRERHGVVINARVKAWRENNREYVRAKAAEKWPEKRITANPQRQLWYRANVDDSKAASRRIYREARMKSPWSLLLHSAKCRAKTRNLPFTLDEKWAVSAWTGKCALTGITFDLGTGRHVERMRSPSIDKIDPKLGYIPENCRFILWAVNAFKGTGTDQEMFEIAKAMVGIISNL